MSQEEEKSSGASASLPDNNTDSLVRMFKLLSGKEPLRVENLAWMEEQNMNNGPLSRKMENDKSHHSVSEYRDRLFNEFIKSLERGVLISRKDFDIYTVQDRDGDWIIPRCIRVRLVDGKLVQGEYTEEEQNWNYKHGNY